MQALVPAGQWCEEGRVCVSAGMCHAVIWDVQYGKMRVAHDTVHYYE